MAIKLTTIGRTFVPDVSFTMDDGSIKANRSLAADEQVSCEVSLATIGQKNDYLGSYTVGNAVKMAGGGDVKQFTVLQYEKCVRKHVKKVTGLEEFKITSGRDLVDHEPTPELHDIIQECFFKVNGIHSDDLSSSKLNFDSGKTEDASDAGEMSEKESSASA